MTLNVLDVSAYQAGISESVLAQSEEILIVKVTQGTSWVNEDWKRQHDIARKLGKLVGLYHFPEDGEALPQVEHFLRTVGDVWGRGYAIPIFDCEDMHDAAVNQITHVTDYPDFTVEWMDTVAKRTGATPWLYAGAEGLNKSGGKFKRFPLWFAAYPYSTPNWGFGTNVDWSWARDTVGGGLVQNGYTVLGWQYTGTGRLNGYAGDLDMSYFYADRAELEAYTGRVVMAADKKNATSTATAKATPNQNLLYPVDEQKFPITQHFVDDLTKYNYGAGHGAVDFATPEGTPIRAIADATVIHADYASAMTGQSWEERYYLGDGEFGGVDANGGIIVLLQVGKPNPSGDGFVSGYAHLSRTDLNKGQRVKRGDIIGYTGKTGNALGPHLHWFILGQPFDWNNGYFGGVDPESFVANYNANIYEYAAAAVEGDFLDMDANQAKRLMVEAVEEYMERAFVRPGSEAEKSFGDKKTSAGAVLRWMDNNLIILNKKLDKISTRQDIIWGGIFTEFSYSGKPGTNEPGIIRLLKAAAGDVDGLDAKLKALQAVAANGGTVTTGAVAEVTGIGEDRLAEIVQAVVSSELEKLNIVKGE